MHRDYYSDLLRLRRHIHTTLYVPPGSHSVQRVIRAIDDEISRIAEENGDDNIEQHINRPPDESVREDIGAAMSTNRKKSWWLLVFLRSLFLDFPLLLLFILMLGTVSINFMFEHYYTKIIESARWRDTAGRLLDHEFTYYERHCDDSDISSSSAHDFTLNERATVDDAVNTMMTHGVIKVPSILSDNVSSALRSFILKRNEELTSSERIPLDGPDNRWSFAIGMKDDDSVAAAVKQLSENYILRYTLEKLLGRNPAVVEITAITAAYGAASQGYHPDVKPLASSVKYGRSFTHSYSLFLPLQNTTARMGATEVCPGTHFCTNDLVRTCSRIGFQVGGDDDSSWWRMGDAVLMNQCTWHRGYAHTDPDGTERVVFILTFIARPQPGLDHRQLSHGTYFHIRPDMYGNTLYDLATPESIRFAWPIRLLRSLGLWAPSSIHYGWDWLTTASLRIANNENGYKYNDLVEFVKNGPLLRFIPPVLFGEPSKDGGWIEFIRFSLERSKDASIIVYGIFITIYFLCAIIVAYNTGTRSSRGLLPLIRRTTFTHIPFILALFVTKAYINQTRWSQSVSDGNIFHPFKYQNDFTPSHTPSTVPEKMDVLHGIRYDAKHLGIYTHYLNFHPGNALWLDSISAFRGYFNYFPDDLQHLALSFIHDTIKQRGGRFLIQQEDGTWRILDEPEALKETWKKLLPNQLVKVLDAMRYVVADARFGNRRIHLSRVMKRQALTYLHMIEDTLVSTHRSILNNAANKRKEEAVQPMSHGVKHRIRSIPLTRHSSLKRKLNRKVSFSRSERENYSLGEIAEINYLNKDRWYHGKVASVVEDGLIDIVYLDNDTETVTLDRIRKFQSLISGHSVRTYVRDCPDCPIRWIRGVIKTAYPNYTYDVLIEGDMIMHRIPLARIVKE